MFTVENVTAFVSFLVPRIDDVFICAQNTKLAPSISIAEHNIIVVMKAFPNSSQAR